MNQELAHKKIIVTGGSRGIGAGIVRALAEAGASVGFTFASRQEAAVEVLKSLPGGGHHIHQMNLIDEGSIESALNSLYDKLGGLDGLVNNAGVTKDQLLMRMKTQDFDDVIHTNLRGAFLTCRWAARPMMKARSGSIVNITSVIGQMGNPGQSNYAASKSGLIGFTKSLSLELASRNIRVNAIAPGFIGTEMTEVLSEDQKLKILEKIPLGRMGTSEDIAEAVKFLLGDKAKYITGHTLSVNGGMYLS